jgi:basic amino acid/polyamine antiporter, APA family
MASLVQEMFRRKPIPRDGGESETTLKRTIGPFQLTMLGVGSTIGTGIFFILSEAVPVAGPSVVISFLIAGFVAGLCVLCYAELAGSIPVSGSSYTYAYSSLGEMPAMIVAGCLLLEYAVCTAAVAVGWSQYVNQLLHNLFGFQLPDAFSYAPDAGGIINLPAIVLIALCASLLVRGTAHSAYVNAIMVVLKVGALVFFAAVAFTGWQSNHFSDFAPFGLGGIMAGSGMIFFSFVGLDAVATAGDEAKNPRRTLPIALLCSLVVITAVYLLVAFAAIGAQKMDEFEGQSAGLAAILEKVVGASWPGTVVAATAVVSIFSAILVTIYGQTRILYSMSRDGMLPRAFSRVNPRTKTPVFNTVVVSVGIAALAGFLPIDFLSELTSVGTLVAFLVVSASVIILRRRAPELPRRFKVPFYPVLPILSILGCLWILKDLRPVTLVVFVIWTFCVLLFWFFSSRRRSALAPTHTAGDGQGSDGPADGDVRPGNPSSAATVEASASGSSERVPAGAPSSDLS